MNALWWLNEEATWPKCVHIQGWLIRLPMTVKILWKKAKQRTSDDCYSALTSSGVQDWTEKQGHQSKGLKLFYPKRILKKECGLVHPRHIKTQMSMPSQPDDLKRRRNYLQSWNKDGPSEIGKRDRLERIVLSCHKYAYPYKWHIHVWSDTDELGIVANSRYSC